MIYKNQRPEPVKLELKQKDAKLLKSGAFKFGRFDNTTQNEKLIVAGFSQYIVI